MRLQTWTMIAAAIFLAAVPAAGHHAQSAAFHMDRYVEIEGVVSNFVFRNPHPVLYVEVTGDDGEIQVWEIEFAPATVLAKRGWTRETFVEGEVISARGHPSKVEGTHGMAAGADITRAAGEVVR